MNRRARYALLQGDCLKVMADVLDGVVDLALCVLPYGITDCAWDKRLPFSGRPSATPACDTLCLRPVFEFRLT